MKWNLVEATGPESRQPQGPVCMVSIIAISNIYRKITMLEPQL